MAKMSLFIITVEDSFHMKRVWMEVGGGMECFGICGEGSVRACGPREEAFKNEVG